MRIFTCIDYDTPFVYLSIGDAVKNLSSYLKDTTVTAWDYNSFKQHKIERYDGECILIFEAGNIPHGNWTIKDLKEYFPKSKIITLCSDSIYWMVNGGQQISDQHLVDLNLELMPQAIDWMDRKGWKVDQWLWTCSDINIKILKEFANKIELNNYTYTFFKKNDLIGVYGPWSIEQPGYRHDMVKWLKTNKCSFIQGGNGGHQDKDIDNIYNNYSNSWINLGTSSHASEQFTKMGCLKGWREWISPFLYCMLINDDHPNIQNAYNKDNIVPTYRYGHFDEIKELVYYYKNNLWAYCEKLEKQRLWAEVNTIDKQLVRLMLKHNIITHDSII